MMDDLDNAIEVLNSLEEREKERQSTRQSNKSRQLIGSVEHFYEKIRVVAIKLNGTLAVGDIIEIGNEEQAIRQKVSSMQINRKDIEKAFEGDSIGISINHPVSEGEAVYKIIQV